MKVTEQCFLVVLFVILYKVLLMFEFVDEILNLNIQMKATEQYFPMELFLMLSFLVLTFESKVRPFSLWRKLLISTFRTVRVQFVSQRLEN